MTVGLRPMILLLLLLCCWQLTTTKEGKSTKKGKKGKQVVCPSQLSPEDLAQVPANSTSNILNRLMVSYDPRIRPNFQGIPVESRVNIFINSFGSIQETTMYPLWLLNRIVFRMLSVTLSCPLDLTLFPMDTQLCKMQLESFGYTTSDLVFMWQSDPVQMDEIALPQFDIKQEDIKYGNCTKYYQGTGYYTCVEVIFTLRRQVGFYMMGVYAPTLLIVVLSWLSFWINPDASAARVPLGILSVLSLSSESMSLASELPKVSYVKAIDIWLIACLLFGFSSLVEYAVVQVILNSPKLIEEEKAKMATKEKALKEKDGKKPSNKTNNTINGTGGTPMHVNTLQVVETRCKKVCTSKSDLRSSDFSIVGSLPRDFELSNFDCYGKPVEVTGALKSQNKANKKPPPPKPVIPAAAKRIDLYARALFPFSFLFFNVVYWSIYL
uniref:Glycine receptor, beta a n=1 Tax=Amphilophus citrinellus TaxID=61819 RepID=A0A3Q0SX34_AMPCI